MKRLLIVVLCLAVSAVLLSASVDAAGLAADATGNEDASRAIQKALDECAVGGGGIVNLPAGRYRLDSPIHIPSDVALVGVNVGVRLSPQSRGTVLLVYAGKGKEEGPSLISLRPNSAIKGVTIYYPEQQVPDVTPYPWTIHGYGSHCTVVDVTLVNPYKGIRIGPEKNLHHHIANVYGCPLKIGISIDTSWDTGRIENVHFRPWPWTWAGLNEDRVSDWGALGAHLLKNATGFEIGMSQWQTMENTSCAYYNTGYRFYRTAGLCYGNFTGVGTHQTVRPLVVEETRGNGLLFTNCEFGGTRDTKASLEIGPRNDGVVQFANCSFYGPPHGILRSAGGKISFSQCNFNEWDSRDTGAYAVTASGGSLSIVGCRFGSRKNHISLLPRVKTAVISCNTFSNQPSIRSLCKGNVEISGNVCPPGK